MLMSDPPAPQRPRSRRTLLGLPLAAGLLLACCGESRADSITAESIWDKANAIENAQQQLPADATVTSTRCTVVPVRNWRYICTLQYTLAPADGSTTPAAQPTN